MDTLIEGLRGAFDTQALVLLLFVLLAVRAFAHTVGEDSNPVEFWHFYASRAADGSQLGDPKKLAVMVGIFASTLFVGYTFWAHPIDSFWPVAVFAIWLIFISGIDVFSAWARSFVDRRFGSNPSTETPKSTKPQ